MDYKKTTIAVLLLAAMQNCLAQVAVPVTDIIAESNNVIRHQELLNALADSSTQVSAQISTAAKMMTMMGSDLNRQNAERQAHQYIAEQKRKNAERYSKRFGAKVKDSCTLVRGARGVNSSQTAKSEIFKKSIEVSEKYLERGRYRSPNEPAKTGEAASLLTRFQKINEFERQQMAIAETPSLTDKTLSLSTRRNGSGSSQYGIEVQKKMILLNPFSEKLPENYDSPNQTAASLAINAHAKWKIEMAKEINKNEMYLLSNKAIAVSGESYYGKLESANKMRTFSPSWVAYTNNDMSERALMADANYIAAQSLVNQNEIIRLLVMLNENLHLSLANDSAYYWRQDSTSTTPQ